MFKGLITFLAKGVARRCIKHRRLAVGEIGITQLCEECFEEYGFDFNKYFNQKDQ